MLDVRGYLIIEILLLLGVATILNFVLAITLYQGRIAGTGTQRLVLDITNKETNSNTPTVIPNWTSNEKGV